MFRMSIVISVLVLAAALALKASAADAPPATAPTPGTFASGIHSPVTHLYEVMNAAVLHDAALNGEKGTLAERADGRPAKPVTTALTGK